MRLVVPGARPDTHADPCLIRLLGRAVTIHDRLTQPPARTLPQIAAAEQVSASYVTRLLRLRSWPRTSSPPSSKAGSRPR